jgi:hypothetical protein
MMPSVEQRGQSSTEADFRVREILGLHFHPRLGSRYWLRRQEVLGWPVHDRIRCREDLWLLGPTPLEDLHTVPLLDFIPQAFHTRLDRFVVGETAGTTGTPTATAYRRDEFQSAFIDPFLRVAEATGFPQGQPWMWVGPSGPHIIGKVVRELARQTGSMDPFSVDFDPRWVRRLAEGSLGRQRYLEHVIEQVLDVLRRESVGVLFITPPALAALTPRMSDRQRDEIHAIHYGGMSLSARTVNEFRAAFPRAVHLAGYGNTLFGVAMEVADGHRQSLDYFPLSERVLFHVVRAGEDEPLTWPPPAQERGGTGRVLFHRLDESCLLAGVLERDQAERVAPSREARALGGTQDGLRNPRPPRGQSRSIQSGIY